MPFYTFLLDFKDGTYISQVDANTEKEACQKWAENLDVSEIVGLGIKGKEILIIEMENEEIVPIKNLKNVWCVSALIRGKLALITFVKTETATNSNPKSKI
jgi:hypothetical protein